MAGQIYLGLEYLIPRVAAWAALFAIAFLDGWRHRHALSRGWQLYVGIVVVLGSMVVQDVLLTTFSVLVSNGSAASTTEGFPTAY
jgi:hypothetical protein